mgnify:CR=1 FL=1
MEGYQEVKEIDLIDLMFYCLKRWRWIIVCMVLFGTLAGVYQYQVTIEDNQVKREAEIKRATAEMLEGEAEVENEPIIFEDPSYSAVKFAIVGTIGGGVFVCVILGMSYVMGGKLQNESNFQKKFGMPLLGIIRKSQKKKRIFSFVDKWINQLEEGPCAKIPRNEQIKIAAVNVQSAIHRNLDEKIKRVMIAGTVASDDVIEICEWIAEEIEDVTFSPFRQIVFQAAALKKLEYYEAILFIEKKDKSYEELIRQEIELALDRNVVVLGAIVC